MLVGASAFGAAATRCAALEGVFEGCGALVTLEGAGEPARGVVTGVGGCDFVVVGIGGGAFGGAAFDPDGLLAFPAGCMDLGRRPVRGS